MRGMFSMIGVTVALSACGGCGLTAPSEAHPGSESSQQARARIFEPYPENEPGPPVVGARPREYQTPIAEPDRVMRQQGEVITWPYSKPGVQPPPAQPTIITAPAATYIPPCLQPTAP